MKLNELLLVTLLWIASVAGAYWFGMDHQSAIDLASQAKISQVIEETREAAKQGTADVISKIVVRNTTIQGKVETIVRDNTVYRDCKHDDAGLQLINQAITGRTGLIGDRSLSGTDATQ